MVKKISFVLAAIYTVAIAYLSLINLADTPVSEMGIGDKIMHAGAYFVLVFLWSFSAWRNNKKSKFLSKILIICGFSIMFGIFIEVLQDELTTYRSFDYFDMLANSIGAILAGIFLFLLNRRFNRYKT